MTTTRPPQVDKILRHPKLASLSSRFRRELIAQLVRERLATMRTQALSVPANVDSLAELIEKEAESLLLPSLKKLINGTGVVLNTNLGRAPIDSAALSDLITIGSGYCNLELDMASGKRGNRQQNIERLLCLLTGCEAAIVVNNNAAAVLLVVNALSLGRKVIISRGELIEIGGSFRLPDVIEAAGGLLCEIGCTNKTHIEDYKAAIDESTGLLLRCHRSNFEIRGFTEQTQLSQLRALSAASKVPLLEDLGSGVLCQLPQAAGSEPAVTELISSGCDLVCFSGDKLLGGPQAGFIVGRRDLVARLAKHPLYRALRPGKLALSLVERTLIAYLSPHPEDLLPALKLLTAPQDILKERAESMAATIGDAGGQLRCRATPTSSTSGGGSLPGEVLPSYGIELSVAGLKPQRLGELLRRLEPPVIGTIKDDRLILDFRAVSKSDEQLLLAALLQLSRQLGQKVSRQTTQEDIISLT